MLYANSNNGSERTNAKVCSLNKSQQMENNRKTQSLTTAASLTALTSFEYVGDEFFSLDDGMMMQLGFVLDSALLFIVSSDTR
jgi:hypothetical protein